MLDFAWMTGRPLVNANAAPWRAALVFGFTGGGALAVFVAPSFKPELVLLAIAHFSL
jgi:hypothetical protein